MEVTNMKRLIVIGLVLMLLGSGCATMNVMEKAVKPDEKITTEDWSEMASDWLDPFTWLFWLKM
jgi:hypothetical protein